MERILYDKAACRVLRPVSVLVVLGLSGSAFANPNSIVPGGQDPDNPGVQREPAVVNINSRGRLLATSSKLDDRP